MDRYRLQKMFLVISFTLEAGLTAVYKMLFTVLKVKQLKKSYRNAEKNKKSATERINIIIKLKMSNCETTGLLPYV